jgi:hypothetical protein
MTAGATGFIHMFAFLESLINGTNMAVVRTSEVEATLATFNAWSRFVQQY